VAAAGAEAPLPLVQPARSMIKPLATIKQPLWNPMLAPTRQRVSRCAVTHHLEPDTYRATRDNCGPS
jgi:hypothetical protein